MKIKQVGLGAAIALMATVGQASASVVLDSNVTGGWSQGTGTVNGAFTLDQEANGVELGLRATIRHVGPITPVTGTNLYYAPSGNSGGLALWNFDYSVNPGSLTGLTALLTITDGTHTSSFDPLAVFDNTTNTAGAKQNSENLGFGFLSGFNPNADVTYSFDLTLKDATGALVSSDTIQVAVPEPSTWAMMVIGFIGLGYIASRRKPRLPFA